MYSFYAISLFSLKAKTKVTDSQLILFNFFFVSVIQSRIFKKLNATTRFENFCLFFFVKIHSDFSNVDHQII